MIADRIGPMHGDQPAAKPMPDEEREPQATGWRGRRWKRLSIISIGILKMPIMFRPRTMMTTPPTRAIGVLVVREEAADRARREPDQHEDDGEAADEGQRVREAPGPGPPPTSRP